MPRLMKVVVGSPMGFKLNITEGLDDVVLNSIIKSLSVYHGDKYVIGKDTMFGVTPHYHIHFFSVKEVTENALKVKRNSMKNDFPILAKSDKLYTGQDLQNADPDRWIAYAIKEQLIKSSNIEITDKILKLAAVALETKRQKKIYSEKKENETKEKKEFKDKLFRYVEDNYRDYEIPSSSQGRLEKSSIVRLLVIKYLMENDRVGSLRKHIIDSYEMYCNIKIYNWNEADICLRLYGY